MKLFRVLAIVTLFYLPAYASLYNTKYVWYVCTVYVYLHLFYINYVKMTHQLDEIDHPINLSVFPQS